MTLPTPDDIERLQFAEAARILRDAIGRLRLPLRRRDRRQLEDVIGVLQRKLPARPERPVPVEPPPRPIEGPAPPFVAQPPYIPSASYRKAEARGQRKTAPMAEQVQSPRARSGVQRQLSILEWRKRATLDRIREADQAEDPTFLAWRAHDEWKANQAETIRKHREVLSSLTRQNDHALAQWKADVAQWHRQHGVRNRLVANLRQDVDALFAGRKIGIPVERATWQFFPPSPTGREQVLAAFREAQRRRPQVAYDIDRLLFAYSLNPQQVLVGAGDFDDYYAFILAGGNRVLLENPVEGNAAYILGRDWRALSRLSKTELLSDHAEDLIRVTHAGDWRTQIKTALNRSLAPRRR